MLNELAEELAQRKSQGLWRQRRLSEAPVSPHSFLDGKRLLSFASNDYLGLANHEVLKQAVIEAVNVAGVGGGASHLISGHHQLHAAAEKAISQFVGMPEALLFSSGYQANLAVITALLDRHSALFMDKLNHASLVDAALLSRAEVFRFPHQDMVRLEQMLAASSAKRKLVAVDAVYSMDGDCAPIETLLTLCERYDAVLYLDDAHGFGVLGEHGEGILGLLSSQHRALVQDRVIYMATLGKAAGVSGAVVAANQTVIDFLVQTARPYIYTTASAPLLSAAILASVTHMQQFPEPRQHLHGLIRHMQENHGLTRWKLLPSRTAIQPVIIGDNASVLKVSEYLLSMGIFVPAIRPPTVPLNTARLRISLSAAHQRDEVDHLLASLRQAERMM